MSGYKGATPIHRVIEHRHVSLPSDWSKFIALEDFARFTSEQIVGKEQHVKTIAVASRFNKPFYIRTDCVMVQDRDTDTLVFRRAHYHLIHCKKFWPKTDTVKKEEIHPK